MTNETQSPCAKCRHAETCTLPSICHALRYFTQTGRPITPPLRYPGPRPDMQKRSLMSEPKPCITRHRQDFTNTQLKTLAGYQREMDEKSLD